MANSVQMELGYTLTDKTRQFTIANVPTGSLSYVKDRIMDINDSLEAGTDDGLADFFRSDDFDDSDPEHIIGKFNKIVDAKIIAVETTPIPIH